tara:strand:- start:79 stop:321 length:243 start_codon:yes stop_codon:yes gene_type:complete
MARKSPVGIFIAATALLASTSISSLAEEKNEKGFLGGLKEWTTDQGVEEESELDEAAKKARKKAKKADLCIPIGEGENCW